MSRLIACGLHGYIEAACVNRYRVRLNLSGGAVIEGIATDVTTDSDKREYLCLERPEAKIELISLSRLEVLTENASFRAVDF